MATRQLFDAATSTYSYLVFDEATRDALLIDPVREHVDRDLQLINELGLTLKYVAETHVHADHVTGAAELRRRTGARSVVSARAKVRGADIEVDHGDTLSVGDHKVHILATPGHTDGCVSYHTDGAVFTGDALLVRGCGRTDFQQGSAERLYESVTGTLFRLPDDTLVFPGHDYRGLTASTIGEEKRLNPRLGAGKSLVEFKRIMNGLQLPPPQHIAEAVPQNQFGGSSPAQLPALNLRRVAGWP